MRRASLSPSPHASAAAVIATLHIETHDFAMRGVFRIERDGSGVRLYSTYGCYKVTRGVDSFRPWRTDDAMLSCDCEAGGVSSSTSEWTYPTYSTRHANGELRTGKGVAPVYRAVHLTSIDRLRFITEVGAGHFDARGGRRKVRMSLKRRGSSIVIARKGTLHLEPLYWDPIRYGEYELPFCDLVEVLQEEHASTPSSPNN